MALKIDLKNKTATRYVTKTVTDVRTRYVTKYRTRVVTRYLTSYVTVVTALVTRYWLNGKVVTTIRTPTRIVVGRSAQARGGYAGPVIPKIIGKVSKGGGNVHVGVKPGAGRGSHETPGVYRPPIYKPGWQRIT